MRVVLSKGAKAPEKAEDDMCYDFFAHIESPVPIVRGNCRVIPTGVKADLGEYHGSLRTRSGMASKNLSVEGGQIDRSYRGEIKVILSNSGPLPYIVQPGDKIAQLKLEHDITVDVEEVESLEDSDRGENGFGSTGE